MTTMSASQTKTTTSAKKIGGPKKVSFGQAPLSKVEVSSSPAKIRLPATPGTSGVPRREEAAAKKFSFGDVEGWQRRYQAKLKTVAEEVKTQVRTLGQTASAHLADWREEVRRVGYWAHPAPFALFCAIGLVLWFVGCCFLVSSWPIALAPPHQAGWTFGGSGGGDSGSATPPAIPVDLMRVMPMMEDDDSSAIFINEEVPIAPPPSTGTGSSSSSDVDTESSSATTTMATAVTDGAAVDGVLDQEPIGSLRSHGLQEKNNLQFLQAKQALAAHDFALAHHFLVSILQDGALEAAAGSSSSFGNFSKGGFLTDLGTTMVFLGQHGQAVQLLESGLAEVAKNGAPANGLTALGIAYRHLGDVQSAYGAFQQAAQFAPKNPKAWSNLGVMAMEVGHLQQADNAFYHASEAHGSPNRIAEDETLLINVKVLQERALGLPQTAEAAMELWYEAE